MYKKLWTTSLAFHSNSGANLCLNEKKKHNTDRDTSRWDSLPHIYNSTYIQFKDIDADDYVVFKRMGKEIASHILCPQQGLPTENSWRLVPQLALNTLNVPAADPFPCLLFSRDTNELYYVLRLCPILPQLVFPRLSHREFLNKSEICHSSWKENVHQFLINYVQNNQKQNVPQFREFFMFSYGRLLICHSKVTCQTKNIYLFELDC